MKMRKGEKGMNPMGCKAGELVKGKGQGNGGEVSWRFINYSKTSLLQNYG